MNAGETETRVLVRSRIRTNSVVANGQNPKSFFRRLATAAKKTRLIKTTIKVRNKNIGRRSPRRFWGAQQSGG